MKMLSTPRGVLATAETEAALQKIADAWPANEKTWIGEWTPPKEKKHSSRAPRRSQSDE
jgi:hypothetical protein